VCCCPSNNYKFHCFLILSDEVHEVQTEKKVKKKRKNKKPKKVTDETERIEEDLSGLMEPDAAGDNEDVKSLSPLEQMEAELLKAEIEEGELAPYT
jgi:phage repressor protein C with HTH and peptisase S24 domain